MMKWVADQWASRQKLSPEESAKFEERGTLLASGLIAGEAITGILLAVPHRHHATHQTFHGPRCPPLRRPLGRLAVAHGVCDYCLRPGPRSAEAEVFVEADGVQACPDSVFHFTGSRFRFLRARCWAPQKALMAPEMKTG